jgi:hypothetical protein
MTVRRSFTIAVFSAAACLAATVPATAQVRDATYRGTLICSTLPFLKGHLRAAMTVNIKGNSAEYSQPVVNPEKGTQLGTETGTGTIDGKNIKLTGGWRGSQPSYEASYSGTFVRRAARLTGTQTWTHEGKTYKRTCSGAIKRPFAVFLKRDKAN